MAETGYDRMYEIIGNLKKNQAKLDELSREDRKEIIRLRGVNGGLLAALGEIEEHAKWRDDHDESEKEKLLDRILETTTKVLERANQGA